MFQFANPKSALLFFTVAICLILYIFGRYQKNNALKGFADLSLLSSIMSPSNPFRFWLKAGFVTAAMFFLILTLMRPQGNPVTKTIKKKGRDLVFVIDISRSMLAEDLAPNRLGKAKQLVSDILKKLEGDRVGLLVFAGSTAIKCPLTLDYNFFQNSLDHIDTADISQGGTHIGDAIRVVSERLFYDQDNKYRDIILITDGEDHESFPIEAAKQAAERGIKIHTVGLGNPDGANIPLRQDGTHRLLKYNNQIVTTRLDETTLKKIAEITQGVFIPVRTNQVDIAKLYTDYISVSEKREAESKESKIWSELYQFFLGISICLLIASALMRETKKTAAVVK